LHHGLLPRGHKLTPELIIKAQTLLDEGRGISNIGAAPGLLPNAVHKAIRYGRLQKSLLPQATRTLH